MKSRLSLLLVFILLMAGIVPAQVTLQEEQDYDFSLQLMNKAMYDLAALQFIRFVDNYANSMNAPHALMNAANCYENLDSLSRASTCYMQLLLKYPQSDLTDKALFNRGKILVKNGEFKNGAATLERLLVFTPQSDLIPEAQLAAAKAYYNNKDYTHALDAVNVIVEKYPDHPLRSQAHLQIAKIRGSQGKMETAFAELDKITGNNLQSEITQQALLAKAKLFAESGRYSLSDSLLVVITKSNTLNNYVLQAGLSYAISRQAFGDYRASDNMLQSLLPKVDDGFYASRLRMVAGDNAFAQKNYEMALDQYSKCDTTDLQDDWKAALYYRLGSANSSMQKYDVGAQWFSRVIDHKDRFSSKVVCNSLLSSAELLQKSSRSLEALTRLKYALQDTYYQEYRDKILFTMGQIQEKGLHDMPGARDSYAAITSSILNSKLADEAQLAIIRSFESESSFLQALQACNRFMKLYPASQYYNDIEQKAKILYQQIPESNTQNVLTASLMLNNGFNTSDAQSLYQLAEYFLNNFHDYQSAIMTLNRAKLYNTNEAINQAELLYKQAFCHRALAEIYYSQHQPMLFRAHQDTVNQIYNYVQTNFAQSDWTTLILYQKIKADLLNMDAGQPRITFLDTMLLRLPESKMDSTRLNFDYLHAMSIINNSADSTDWLALQKANLICGNVLKNTLDENLRDKTLLLNAKILYKLGENDSTLTILSGLRNINNHTGVHAQFLQASIYKDQQRYSKAFGLFANLMENHSYSDLGKQSAIHCIQILLQQGQVEKAEALLARNKSDENTEYLPDFFFNTTDPDWLWISAKVSQSRGNDLESTKILRKYLYTSSTREHHPEALLLLGNIARDNHSNEIALGHYAELAQNFSQDTLAQQALINSAQIFYDMGDYTTALQLYQGIKSRLTGDLKTLAYEREVVCEINLGRLSHAKQLAKSFSKNFNSPASEAEFLYTRGLYHIKQKDFDDAEDAFKDLSKKYDDIPAGGKGQLGLARMYVITGKPEEALEILTRIPDKYDDPEILATAYLNLGDFYYENRQLPQCINACEKVIELVDSGMLHKSSLNLLIKTYDQYKLWDKAIALIREFITKYPNDPDLMIKRIQIGTMLHDIKDYDRSISYLKQLKPTVSAQEEPEVQYWIARSYLDKGDIDQAIVEFLKVKFLSKPTKLPWGVTALYEAGNAYYKIGNASKAIELLEQVVRERGVQDNIGRAANERIKTIKEETGQAQNG